jgi:enoyl-CoA hydratase/carnithine racemase
MELILLADIIDAQEALRIGLVNRVVPAEQLEHETLKLAERLAQGPTVAYGLAKTRHVARGRPQHGSAQPGDRSAHPGSRGGRGRVPREAAAALHRSSRVSARQRRVTSGR